jgi:hypothetical protein
MPKRKIPDSLLPAAQEEAALAAIKEALKHPRQLTVEEEREFLARRAHGAIERHEYEVLVTRHGERRYRDLGKSGGGRAVPPYYHQMLERQRDFETECAKVDRALTTTLRNRTRRTNAKAEERARNVNTKFDNLSSVPEHNRAGVIARELKIPVRTVRDIIRKKKRRTPKGSDSG